MVTDNKMSVPNKIAIIVTILVILFGIATLRADYVRTKWLKFPEVETKVSVPTGTLLYSEPSSLSRVSVAGTPEYYWEVASTEVSKVNVALLWSPLRGSRIHRVPDIPSTFAGFLFPRGADFVYIVQKTDTGQVYNATWVRFTDLKY